MPSDGTSQSLTFREYIWFRRWDVALLTLVGALIGGVLGGLFL